MRVFDVDIGVLCGSGISGSFGAIVLSSIWRSGPSWDGMPELSRRPAGFAYERISDNSKSFTPTAQLARRDYAGMFKDNNNPDSFAKVS